MQTQANHFEGKAFSALVSPSTYADIISLLLFESTDLLLDIFSLLS